MFYNILFNYRFPLLVDFITDEETKKRLTYNKYFIRKYNDHEEIIRVFIHEINNRFDKETILDFINEIVLRYPDELMVSFIVSYLNSTEYVKSNIDVIHYYKNILKLGNDAIHYIEKHGIMTSFEWKEIPETIIDDRNKVLKTGLESFKGTPLNDLYKELNIKQKEYVNGLLEAKSFSLLEVLFEDYQDSLASLLDLLMVAGIDSSILNTNVINNMNSTKHFMYLTYMLFDTENKYQAIKNIKTIIKGNRYELLIELINNDLIKQLSEIEIEDINIVNDEDLIRYLKSIHSLSLINEEYSVA